MTKQHPITPPPELVGQWQDKSPETQIADHVQYLATRAALAQPEPTARPEDEYHEDMGAVLWWRFPIDEPPYCGSPLDSEWPGYHTHFTPLGPMPIPANNTKEES